MEHYLPFFVGWEHDIHADMARSTAELGNAFVKQSEIRLELPRRSATDGEEIERAI
jgi:hypothetical protein